MTYITQGTVQLRQTEKKCFVAINPVADYSVKHQDTEYVVFAGAVQHDGSLASIILPKLELPLQPVNDGIRMTLIQAALNKISLEVEIDDKLKIVGVKVPPAFK